MLSFTYDIPTKIFFGAGQMAQLREISKLGSRALIVYGGGSVKRSGLLDQVHAILGEVGMPYAELPGVEPNPRIGTVRRGVALCRENRLDVVLAVGGGSSIDCAKVIAAGACYDGDAWELVLDKSRIQSALPLATVLTLAATGSEMNGGSVISNPDTNEKLSTNSPCLYPKFSILDPTLTYSVPKAQTAAGVADIMSHVFESYFTPVQGAEVQAQIAEGILRTCIQYGPVAYAEPENYEARANLMWAGTLAINGLCSLGAPIGWSVHPLEHELSAYYDLTHGVGLAILTPHWMRYVLNGDTVGRFARFGENVWGFATDGDPCHTAERAISTLSDFWRSLDIPMTLTDVSIDDRHFEAMAAHCEERTIAGYVPLLREDCVKILRAAL